MPPTERVGALGSRRKMAAMVFPPFCLLCSLCDDKGAWRNRVITHNVPSLRQIVCEVILKTAVSECFYYL